MEKNKASNKKKFKRKLPKDLQWALDNFDRIRKLKIRRYHARQKFLKKTFGKIVRMLEKHERAHGRMD